jgi:hypothetical protein
MPPRRPPSRPSTKTPARPPERSAPWCPTWSIQAGDRLSAATDGTGLDARFDAARGQLILDGSASPAVYQAVLRSVSYASDAELAGVSQRVLTVTVTDPDGASAALSTLLTLQPPPTSAIDGTPDDDVLIGTPGDDQIQGFPGHDHLVGQAGDDLLRSGKGNDDADGGPGRDTLFGGNGADTLRGGDGDDTLVGGADADLFVFYSVVGSDTLADFVSGEDRLAFSQAALPVGNGDRVLDGAVIIAGPGGFPAGAELVLCSVPVGDVRDPAGVAAALGTAGTAYRVGDHTLFAVNDGIDGAVYYFTAGNGNAGVEAGELALLGVLRAAPVTTLADYLLVA